MNQQGNLVELPLNKGRGDAGSASAAAQTTADKPKTSRRKRFLIAAVLLTLGAVGVYYGAWYWTTGRFLESTDDAYVRADSTIIAPKVPGYLKSVLVTDNEAVATNKPLAQIDDRDYAVALKQAKANVRAAEATIDNIKASIDQQRTVIKQAQATVALDDANLKFAQQDNDRYTTLAKSGSGSVQNAQQAISRLGIAKATLDRDRDAVATAEKQVGIFQAQLAKAQADLAHNQALEDQALLNLDYTTILAPVDGVVGNRTLRVGQYVQAGTALMTVVPLSDVYVVANFKETQLTDVRPGQPVDIAVDSFPDHDIKGVVDSIAPASGQEFALLPPDNATGNFTKIVQRVPVKIKVPADTPLNGRLRPGMSVIVTIDTKGNQKS